MSEIIICEKCNTIPIVTLDNPEKVKLDCPQCGNITTYQMKLFLNKYSHQAKYITDKCTSNSHEDNENIKMFCASCKLFLCKDCSMCHKDHSLLNIPTSKLLNNCTSHKKLNDYICMTCNQFICDECLINHNFHDIKKFNDLIDFITNNYLLAEKIVEQFNLEMKNNFIRKYKILIFSFLKLSHDDTLIISLIFGAFVLLIAHYLLSFLSYNIINKLKRLLGAIITLIVFFDLYLTYLRITDLTNKEYSYNSPKIMRNFIQENISNIEILYLSNYKINKNLLEFVEILLNNFKIMKNISDMNILNNLLKNTNFDLESNIIISYELKNFFKSMDEKYKSLTLYFNNFTIIKSNESLGNIILKKEKEKVGMETIGNLKEISHIKNFFKSEIIDLIPINNNKLIVGSKGKIRCLNIANKFKSDFIIDLNATIIKNIDRMKVNKKIYISSLCMLNDNKLAFCTNEGDLKIYTLDFKNQIYKEKNFVKKAQSPCIDKIILLNEVFATSGLQFIKIWNKNTIKNIKVIKSHSNVRIINMIKLKNKNILVSCGYKEKIVFTDLYNYNALSEIQMSDLTNKNSLIETKNNKLLVGGDGYIKIIDTDSFTAIGEIKDNMNFTCFLQMRNGKIISGNCDKSFDIGYLSLININDYCYFEKFKVPRLRPSCGIQFFNKIFIGFKSGDIKIYSY